MLRTSNLLTFDIEEWYHANYPGIDTESYASIGTNLPALVDRLLDALASVGATSTFFCLGSVCANHPAVVRSIAEAGHEVASHGYSHRAVHTMSPAEFRNDVMKSCDILEQAVGCKVLGFRAPSFSVTRDVLPWYYDELSAAGIEYSSSVFCGKTFLYGIEDFPYRIHRPSSDGWTSTVMEIPVTRIAIGPLKIPAYFRLLPAWALKSIIAIENRSGRGAVLYLHPREIDPGQPRLPLGRWASVIHYFGVGGCEAKLQNVLNGAQGSFTTIREALGGTQVRQSAKVTDV